MNLGNVLSALAATYATVEPSPTVVIKAPASKARAVKANDGSQAAPKSNPSDNKPAPIAMVLPAKGTLDAESFMLAMRNAGKRKTEEGRPFFDLREVRNDQIVAIAGFVGYDNRQSFGSQELRAMTAAKQAMSKVQPIGQQAPYSRNGRIETTVKAYVAGMPDEHKRRLADLQGREKLAIETRDEHVKQARNPELTPETRKWHASMAAIEHRRIGAIQRDIVMMG